MKYFLTFTTTIFLSACNFQGKVINESETTSTTQVPDGTTTSSSTTTTTTTAPAVPSDPSGLTATATSGSTVDLGWTDNSSNETGFKIFRSTDNISFSELASVAVNLTSYSDLGLISGTTYYYKVLAINSGVSSVASAVASATPPILPAAPSGLAVSGSTATSISLSWTDNANNETSLEVARSTDGVTYSLLTTLAANSSTHGDTGLSVGQIYYYKVRATNVAGSSAYSSVVNQTTVLNISVESNYPVTPSTNPEWNYYVKANGTGAQAKFNANNTACNSVTDVGAAACLHAGEIKKVTLGGIASCSGLSMVDQLAAFDWSCYVVTGNATFYSTGLKVGKGLKDLIAAGGTSFTQNRVTLSGTLSATSSLATWWNNPVVVAPANSGSGAVMKLDGIDDDGVGNDAGYTSGTIFTVISSTTTRGYNINADQYSLVTLAGVTLSWDSSGAISCFTGSGEVASADAKCIVALGGTRFSWIEVKTDSLSSATRGIFLYASYFNRIHLSTATNNGTANGRGVEIRFSDSNTISELLIPATQRWGLLCNGGNSNLLKSSSITTAGYFATDFTTCHNWTVQNNSFLGTGADYGLYLVDSDNMIIDGNSFDLLQYPIYIATGTTGTVVTNLTATRGTGYTINCNYASSASGQHKFSNLKISGGAGAYFLNCSDSTFYNVTMTNGLNQGLDLSNSHNIRLSQALIAGVGTSTGSHNGFRISNSNFSVISQITLANIGGNGMEWGGGSGDSIVHNSVNTNTSGSYIGTSLRVTFSQYATAHSGSTYAINASNGSDHKVTGNFLKGSLTCLNTGATNPGFSNTCAMQNASDATVRSPLSFASSFVGKISASQSLAENQNDTANTNDTNCYSLYSGLTNFLSFDNLWRGWGLDGALAFPDSSNSKKCSSAGGYTDCRIWDWRLASGDTILKNTTGDGSTQNPSFIASASCPSVVNGDQYLFSAAYTYPASYVNWQDGVEVIGDAIGDDDGICEAAEACRQRYLKAAVEILNDGIGDEDGLCESNEACLYTPNFGAYQGTGTLATCNFNSNSGPITGVTIYGY